MLILTTGQPMEQQRIWLMLLIGMLLSCSAQAFGLFASSLSSNITVNLNTHFALSIARTERFQFKRFQITLVLGSAVMAIHMIFSGVLVLKKDVQPWLKWIFDIIFLNHANEGMVLALFGYNRGKLECKDIYCHFEDPKEFLKLIEAPASISFHSFFLIFCTVHLVTYVIVMIKLKRIN